LQQAKLVSLGFLYWLQTKAPVGNGAAGAPELRLHKDAMDTSDGLSKFPYIRESRRFRILRTMLEQDVSAKFAHGIRAAHFCRRHQLVCHRYPPVIVCRRSRNERAYEAVSNSARRSDTA